jgi:NAD+ kinase
MSRRARRIAVLGHIRRAQVRREAVRLRRRLERRRFEVRFEDRLAQQMGIEGHPLPALAAWCDLLVTLGGDGTVLAGARAMNGRRGALLPVNLGGLGFLAAAEAGEMDGAIDAAIEGRWRAVRRRVLSAVVTRGKRTLRRSTAMNDAVVKSAGGYSAVHLQLYALGQDLGHLVADGLIAASAGGSTAYSLSAGGPVLSPDIEAVVVTPVSPHSLGSRPLVLPGHAEVRIKVLGGYDRTVLLLDGQESIDLEAKDEVRVKLDRRSVRLIQNPDRVFTFTLRKKLGWQGSAKRSL